MTARPKEVDEAIREFLEELESYPDAPSSPLPAPVASGREAEVVPFPPLLNEQELWRRQQVIDQCWERTRALEAEMAARSCHVGLDDPDYRPRPL